jgi:hypothetical protein
MQTSFERLSSHFRLITAHCGIAFIVAIAVLSLPANYAHAQATASLQGIVTDSSRAVIPNAKIVAHNLETGEDRDATSDSAGVYALPSLPVGTYRLNITAAGMQSIVVSGVDLEVGQIAAQNFTLQVASSNEVVQVTASTPLITSETTTVGAVMNSRTVQDIPLNGRHFLDMGFLIPGSVTPPQNATLAAPLRGQGFFGFNTAGGREDTVNFMVNGVNLNDFGGEIRSPSSPPSALFRSSRSKTRRSVPSTDSSQARL